MVKVFFLCKENKYILLYKNVYKERRYYKAFWNSSA